jgi:hypothetical protein
VEAIRNRMPRSGEAGVLGGVTRAAFFRATGTEIMKDSKNEARAATQRA